MQRNSARKCVHARVKDNSSELFKHLKWLIGAAMWPGLRIAVAAMRLLAKLASKFLAAAQGSFRYRGAVEHIAGNAAPKALS